MVVLVSYLREASIISLICSLIVKLAIDNCFFVINQLSFTFYSCYLLYNDIVFHYHVYINTNSCLICSMAKEKQFYFLFFRIIFRHSIRCLLMLSFKIEFCITSTNRKSSFETLWFSMISIVLDMCDMSITTDGENHSIFRQHVRHS